MACSCRQCLCSQTGPREPMSESEAPLPSECLTGRAQKELRERTQSCPPPAAMGTDTYQVCR